MQCVCPCCHIQSSVRKRIYKSGRRGGMDALGLSVLPAMLCIRQHTPAYVKAHTAAYVGVEASAASLPAARHALSRHTLLKKSVQKKNICADPENIFFSTRTYIHTHPDQTHTRTSPYPTPPPPPPHAPVRADGGEGGGGVLASSLSFFTRTVLNFTSLIDVRARGWRRGQRKRSHALAR